MTKGTYKKKKVRVFHRVKEKVNICLPKTSSKPVFVMGCQRSGTTMLMDVFELNFNTLVYNESDTKAFEGSYRIIGFEHLQNLVNNSNFEFTVFKPLADSHRIDEFIEFFPECQVLWVYRNYKDMVNSSVVKWGRQKENSIRVLGRGAEVTDWFGEGLTDSIISVVHQVYRDDFSDHDCTALWWWCRNKIALEKKIYKKDNVLLVNYDNLVTEPGQELIEISRFLAAKRSLSPKGYVHAKSINRREFPEINVNVRELCKDLTDELEKIRITKRKNHYTVNSRPVGR